MLPAGWALKKKMLLVRGLATTDRPSREPSHIPCITGHHLHHARTQAPDRFIIAGSRLFTFSITFPLPPPTTTNPHCHQQFASTDSGRKKINHKRNGATIITCIELKEAAGNTPDVDRVVVGQGQNDLWRTVVSTNQVWRHLTERRCMCVCEREECEWREGKSEGKI